MKKTKTKAQKKKSPSKPVTKTRPSFVFGGGEDKVKLSWGSLEKSKILLNIDEDKLMNLEKERLGIPKDRLVFIGMANLSKYYWCAWQYYLKSKREEFTFFYSYLVDRLNYSNLLGFVKNPPKNVKEILKIGDDIKFKYVEKLLKKEQVLETSEDAKNLAKTLLEGEEDPLMKGRQYETLHAETYPTIRWNFRYKDLVLVGVPDGITDDFVYEFKYTGQLRYIKQTLITAACQADFYGVYFKRPNKRVQIFCKEDEKVQTFVDPVNEQKVIDLLEKWIDIINGNLPIAPQPWKCNICEFKEDCIILKQEERD